MWVIKKSEGISNRGNKEGPEMYFYKVLMIEIAMMILVVAVKEIAADCADYF